MDASAIVTGTLGAIVPAFAPFAMSGAVFDAVKLGLDAKKLYEHCKRPVAILLKAKERTKRRIQS